MSGQTVNFIVERHDNEELAEANEQLGMIVARLHIENTKLRELVARYYEELRHGPEPAEWVTDDLQELRELGVVVDR